jgi:hypothetical protein
MPQIYQSASQSEREKLFPELLPGDSRMLRLSRDMLLSNEMHENMNFEIRLTMILLLWHLLWFIKDYLGMQQWAKPK